LEEVKVTDTIKVVQKCSSPGQVKGAQMAQKTVLNGGRKKNSEGVIGCLGMPRKLTIKKQITKNSWIPIKHGASGWECCERRSPGGQGIGAYTKKS